MTCGLCEDTGWVCENHPEEPWDGDHACGCGAAGMPCVRCNPSDLDNPPGRRPVRVSNSTKKAGAIRLALRIGPASSKIRSS
jgi:hypothetical protein